MKFFTSELPPRLRLPDRSVHYKEIANLLLLDHCLLLATMYSGDYITICKQMYLEPLVRSRFVLNLKLVKLVVLQVNCFPNSVFGASQHPPTLIFK